MADKWIYEFLYRGHPGEGGAWHLIIADQFGRQTTLNMRQAEAQGWTLPVILETLNTANLTQIEQMRIDVAQMQSDFAAIQEQAQAWKQEAERLHAQLSATSQSNPSPAGEGEQSNAEQNPKTETDDGGGSPQP